MSIKENLLSIITEKFKKDEIDVNKFIKLYEKISNYEESKIITELWGKVAVGAGVAAVATYAFLRSMKQVKMDADKDYIKCKQQVEKIIGPKLRRAENAHEKTRRAIVHSDGSRSYEYNSYTETVVDELKDKYNDAMDQCENIYDRKIEAIKKKIKERKEKEKVKK